MVGHKICFYGKIQNIIPKLSLLLLIWSIVICIPLYSHFLTYLLIYLFPMSLPWIQMFFCHIMNEVSVLGRGQSNVFVPCVQSFYGFDVIKYVYYIFDVIEYI